VLAFLLWLAPAGLLAGRSAGIVLPGPDPVGIGTTILNT
jgi:hypothetical protein